MLKLMTFACPGEMRLGALLGGYVVDLSRVSPALPTRMFDLVAAGEPLLDIARAAVAEIAAEDDRRRETLVRERKMFPLASVHVLAPLPRPRRNVFCIGRNYGDHTREVARILGPDMKTTEYPMFFTKPPTAVVGPDGAIPADPKVTEQLDYEAELAVLIGRPGRNIDPAKALEHVFGYTVGNDVSARDLQKNHIQWLKGKGLDNSCPLGPVVVPSRDIGDPQDLDICLRVNGETRQTSNTRNMIWGVADLVSWLSRGITLEVGDILLAGTPEGVGHGMTPPRYLRPGDVIEAEVEKIGILRSHIVAV